VAAVAATWTLVDPVARRRQPLPAAVAPPDRRLRTIGFFSNSKQHAAEVGAAMAAALRERHGIEARFYSKPNASVGGSDHLIVNIATECDAAVVGSGD
jgi:hypothetical protein